MSGPRLPPGIPSSLPWLLCMIGTPLLVLAAEFVYLAASPIDYSPLAVALPLVGILTGAIAAWWLWGRHRYLVELGRCAEKIGPENDGRFNVRTDDETGYLAAEMNGMAARYARTLAEARSAGARLQKILSSVDTGILLADASGRVVFVNPAAESLLGRHSSVLVGRTVLEGILQHELADAVQTATISGESRVAPLVLGRRRVLAQVSPFGEAMAGAVVVLQDQEEQARLDSVRRDFIANVSHELRTPLASIRAMAETLQSGAREDPKVADDFLQIIIRESDRLARLTDDLLDLARYEAGRLEFEPVNLEPLITDVLRQIEPKASASGLKLYCEIRPVPSILGDKAALRQVFLNLLDNAVKYTEAGSVSLRGCIDESGPAGDSGRLSPIPALSGSTGRFWIRLDVSDTGPGIPAEHLSRIFERFYRVDKGRSRDLGGTGLGLSIVRHVVESHDGSIEVSSAVGEGTVFTIWLPAGHDAVTAGEIPDPGYPARILPEQDQPGSDRPH